MFATLTNGAKVQYDTFQDETLKRDGKPVNVRLFKRNRIGVVAMIDIAKIASMNAD